MSKNTLLYLGLAFSVLGISITLYTVFDGLDTNKNIQNAGWILMLFGVGLSTYSRKK